VAGQPQTFFAVLVEAAGGGFDLGTELGGLFDVLRIGGQLSMS
jgi:hypothetical protein